MESQEEDFVSAGRSSRAAARWSILGLILAGLYLAIVIPVHFSTYFGFDPEAVTPMIWGLHLFIFVMFIPLVKSRGKSGAKGQRGEGMFGKDAPKIYENLLRVLALYVFVVFVWFLIFSEGGHPSMENGKYVLMNKSVVVRELTEQEFHYQRGLVIRGFSSAWLLFGSMCFMTFLQQCRSNRSRGDSLVDAETKLQAKAQEINPPESKIDNRLMVVQSESQEESFEEEYRESDESDVPINSPPSILAATALVTYLVCLLFVLLENPLFSVFATVPVIWSLIHLLRQKQSMLTEGRFVSCIGFCSLPINFLVAIYLSQKVGEFVYVSAFIDPVAAWNHEIYFVHGPEAKLNQLSDGSFANGRVMGGMIFPKFLLMALCTMGFTQMAETFGSFLEDWGREGTFWKHVYPATPLKVAIALGCYLLAVVTAFLWIPLSLTLVVGGLSVIGFLSFAGGKSRKIYTEHRKPGCLIALFHAYLTMRLMICGIALTAIFSASGFENAIGVYLVTDPDRVLQIFQETMPEGRSSLPGPLFIFPGIAVAILLYVGQRDLLQYVFDFWKSPPSTSSMSETMTPVRTGPFTSPPGSGP